MHEAAEAWRPGVGSVDGGGGLRTVYETLAHRNFCLISLTFAGGLRAAVESLAHFNNMLLCLIFFAYVCCAFYSIEWWSWGEGRRLNLQRM